MALGDVFLEVVYKPFCVPQYQCDRCGEEGVAPWEYTTDGEAVMYCDYCKNTFRLMEASGVIEETRETDTPSTEEEPFIRITDRNGHRDPHN